MATVTIIQGASTKKAPKIPKQDRPYMKAGKLKFGFPWAPTGGSLDGYANTYDTTARPGRRPLVQLTGGNLPTLGLTFTLVHRDWTQSIEGWLTALRRIANTTDRITIHGMSPSEAGPWRMTACAVAITQRQPGSNVAVRADVTLTLTYANDANPKLGPVQGGKKHGHKGVRDRGGSSKKHTRHYVVKKGDTLSGIAEKFYGEPGKWKQIAKANKITHPRSLKVGRKLTIPPEK